MSDADTPDWNPGTYHRFRGLRLRPALDLLQAVGPLPEGPVVDLGCGTGAMAGPLAALNQRLIGVDGSPAMLAEARATGLYDEIQEADIADFRTDAAPALIFSNAALHWLPDHQTLLPRLVRMLAPGGTLAVQVPHQNRAPSHRLWRQLGAEMFPGRIEAEGGPGVLLPVEYHRLLAPMGALSLWETEYYQPLPAATDGHPVRRFTEATYARPILAALTEDEQAQLIAAYETPIAAAYPADADGGVLFPFRRLFFTLQTPG